MKLACIELVCCLNLAAFLHLFMFGGFMNSLKVFMKRHSRALFSAALISALFLGFQNCSKVKFSNLSSNVSKINDINNGSSVPFGALQINNGDSYTRDVNVVLSLNATDATEMYISNDAACKTGGAWQPYVLTLNWVLGANNQDATVYAKFRDDKLNESTCVSATIVHDDIPPVIVVDVPAPLITNSNAVSTKIHATDTGSSVKEINCILPGESSAVPCSEMYTGLNLADGTHTISHTAIDNAGNVSAPVAQSFMVDTTPPAVTLNQTPAAQSGSDSASFGFTGTDALSGVKGFECQLDGQAYVACTSGHTYTGLPQGPHSFSVRAIDNAGNTSSAAGYAWTVDSAQPTIQFTQTPPAITNSTNAPFAFIGQDQFGQPLSQYECKLNGGNFQACTSPTNAVGVVSGQNTFSVRGRNGAGVYSSEISYSWLVDLTGPTVIITQGPPPLTNSTSATFTLAVHDSLSGVAQVVCILDGGAPQDCSSLSQSYSALPTNMDHTFVAQVTDKAGNVATSAPYVWTIDTKPPSLVIVSAPSSLSSQNTATFEILGTDEHGPITYTCRLDNESLPAACGTIVNYSGLSDGAHTFYAQARDAAGNLSEIKTYSWNIVTVGPVIEFTKVPNPTILDTEQGVLSYTITDAFSVVTSSTCKLDTTNLPCSVMGATITFPLLSQGSHTFTLIATNAAGITSSKSYTFNVNHAPTCTTTLETTSIPTKILFVVDTSGSNHTGTNCQLSETCTDRDKKMRAGSIQTFFNRYGSLIHFNWGFLTFQGQTATALINNGNVSSPKFSNAAAMQSAINYFKNNIRDTDSTPYGAALNMANLAITTDPDRNSATQPQYIIVFMSDGMPKDVTSTTSLNNRVRDIVNLLPGRISFNTIYYGPSNQDASNLLQSMANTGNGKFLNTNTNPTGLDFEIRNVINVPVEHCE